MVLFVILLWAALSLLLLSARRPGRWRIAVWSGLLLPAPWVIYRFVVLHWGTHLSPWVRMPRIAAAAAVWVLILLLWRKAYVERSEQFIRLAASVLVCLGISGSLLLVFLIHSWWEARRLNDPLPLRQKGATVGSGTRGPRVIWIILDELSYDQLYEHRSPGLHLPAFDALAAQSTVFTHVVPAGIETDKVVPALFTGRPVNKIASSPEGGLLLPDPKTGRWRSFAQHDTVFQDALNSGYQTGIAGWYNPYCRIMPTVLFDCAWSDNAGLIDGVAPDRTLSSNLLGLFDALLGNASLSTLFRASLSYRDRQRAGQIADYRGLVTDGDRLLADSSAGFILLHMPFPHPPGFYDQVTRRLSTKRRSYIDNLALADSYVTHVRALLETTHEWNTSTVLVTGDHSWRTALIWKQAGDWTTDEERASNGGRFDDRPAYILKLSGQKSGQRFDSPFHALETRRLLDAIFTDRIATAEDLQGWLRPAR